MSENIILEIKNAIQSHPDFPKKGVLFRDFLPILQNPTLFDKMISLFQNYIKEKVSDVHCIVGIESRGFLLGPTLALKMNIPFIPVRKPGKLPGNVKKEFYSLEYGSDALEIQVDAVTTGQNIIIIDDLIATGGSMEAAVKLIRSIGGNVQCCLAVIELNELKGRSKISAP
ncbi:Adenine phosphoribosyltransferase, partial [Stegodyphus mimosarum]